MLSKAEEDKFEEKIHPGIHKEVSKMAKKHKFSHTHIEHHSDGSATVHHVHENGSAHDKKHAAVDLDAVHDSMQDHLGEPNPGEAEAAMGQHGIPAPAAAAAGIPAPPPAAPAA